MFGAIGVLAGSEMLARLLAFAATALLARRLGPDGLGVLGFATAVCGYLALGVNGGLLDVGTREVARAPGRAAALYSSVASVRLVLAAVAMTVLAIAAWWLPKPPLTSLVLFLSGLSLFSLAIDPMWVFKGLERQVMAGTGLVIGQLVYAIGIVLLVQQPSEVTRVPIILFIGELTGAMILGAVLFRHTRPVVALAEGWRMWRQSGYLGAARLFRTLVITSDIVLLSFMTTDRDVGLYTAAYRVAFLLMAVAAAVSAAYLPSYARAVVSGDRETRPLVERSLATALLIGAPLVAGVVVTARPVLSLLFGGVYAEAAAALQLLALSVGMLFFYWTASTLLIAAHRTREYAAMHGASASLNIILNLILIPRMGITGAAAATLVAEAVNVIPSGVILHRAGALPSIRAIAAPVGAAAGMAGVLTVAGTALSLPIQVVLGSAIYALLVRLFGGRRLLSLIRAPVAAPDARRGYHE